MFGKKVYISTEEMISNATIKVSSDIADVQEKVDNTLSVFRQAAVDLDNANCELRGKVSMLDKTC